MDLNVIKTDLIKNFIKENNLTIHLNMILLEKLWIKEQKLI